MTTTRASVSGVEGSEELTRGHKKKARTRQQLLDAALRIYARKGAGELALNELAAEAGVSNGTVYNYFKTREDVLEAVGIALAEQLSVRVAAVSTGVTNGAERLAIGVRTFALQAQQNPEWAAALISVVRREAHMQSMVAAYVRADLQIGFRQGVFRYADEALALWFVTSATLGAMAAILEGRVDAQHDSNIAEMILLALGVPAGEARRVATIPLPASAALTETGGKPSRAGRGKR